MQLPLYRTESTVVLVTMESVKKQLNLLFWALSCIHFYLHSRRQSSVSAAHSEVIENVITGYAHFDPN